MRIIVFCLCLLITSTGIAGDKWQPLAPGMELGTFKTNQPSKLGDSKIRVLRMDPNLWELEFVGLTRNGGSEKRTAKQWSKVHQLAASINAGMFGTDDRTHVGFLRYRDHLNNDNVNKYQSVAAFDPRRDGLPRFKIFDLDNPGVTLKTIQRDYASAIQNLRLIKRPKQNRWGQQGKMWSEAALGEDESGRILFIFCRSPFTMHDFNQELLNLSINIVCVQHLEGGPEAQLYVNVGGVEIELFGSYETAFMENGKNNTPWPVPNVIGVRPKVATPK